MTRQGTRWMEYAACGLLLMVVGCGGAKKPPVARATAPPGTVGADTRGGGPNAGRSVAPPAPQSRIEMPVEPVREDQIAAGSLDDLNRQSPLLPAFFDYDASDISSEAQRALDADATQMRQHPSWVVTIEGHCDERGTAEYNLALGERRAVAARDYLVSVGIPAERLRTVSYGKEFPFDAGHTDAAYAKNRRAHLVITAQ